MENQEHGRRERGVDEDRHANERPGGFERVHAFTCTRTQGTRIDGETHAMVRGGTTAATCPPAKKG